MVGFLAVARVRVPAEGRVGVEVGVDIGVEKFRVGKWRENSG
jgi:hypothetical protein